jgi:cell division protein FtsB
MNSFDNLAQEIFRQKQRMDALQAENNELRRHLAELREGRGLFIIVEGQRYPMIASREKGENDYGMR